MENDSKPPQEKPSKAMLWIIAGLATFGVLKATGVISGGPC